MGRTTRQLVVVGEDRKGLEGLGSEVIGSMRAVSGRDGRNETG